MGDVLLGDVDGLVLIGRFLEVERSADGGMAFAKVEVKRYDGQTVVRNALFFPADRDTGEVTRMGREVMAVHRGEMVALRIKAEVSKKKGTAYLTCYGIDVLPEVPSTAADASGSLATANGKGK